MSEPLSDFEQALLTVCHRKGLTPEEIAVKTGQPQNIVTRTLRSLKKRNRVSTLTIDKETRYFSGRTPYIKAVTAQNNARCLRSKNRYDMFKARWSEYTIAAQLKSVAYRDNFDRETIKICGGCGMAVAVNVDVASKLSGLAVTLPGFVEAHLGRFSPDVFSGSYDSSWFIASPDGTVGVFCCCESCKLIMELLGPWFWAADTPTLGSNTPLGALLLRLLEIVVLRDENPHVRLKAGTRKYAMSKTAVRVLTVRARQIKGIAAAITGRITDSMLEASPLLEKTE